MSRTKAVEGRSAQDAPGVGHVARGGTVMPTRSASVSAACIDVRINPITDVDRKPAAVDAGVEGVGRDHGVIAVLRRPEICARSPAFQSCVQTVEDACEPIVS